MLFRSVPFALLQAIAELSEAALHHSLTHLQAAEFLYETRLFPEPEYTFKHALTHEVAYGGLLLERRRTLHARIVEALETLYADRVAEQVERLAQHAFRGEVWDKAAAYCRQAGNKAVACFEQALSALRQLPESHETIEQAIDLRFDLRGSLQSLEIGTNPVQQQVVSIHFLDQFLTAIVFESPQGTAACHTACHDQSV